MPYLLLIIYATFILVMLILPKISSNGRTISKRQIFIFTTFLALCSPLFLFLNFTKVWLVYISIYSIPIITFLLPDFRIIYNVEEKNIREKVLRLLDTMFCKYKLNPHKNLSIDIVDIGKITSYNLGIVNLMIIRKNKNSPKAKIIFDNIFKIFYDVEY